LIARVHTAFPPAVHGMLAAGLKKLVDFQDPEYGREYLDLVEGFLRLDRDTVGAARGYRMTSLAAKHIANAMAYDDVIRVADLKTRASRFDRIRREVTSKPDQLVYTTEFMHPRMDEVCGTLPAWLGKAIEGRPKLFRALDRIVNRGRRVQTSTVRWFLPLYVIGGLKRFRRSTLRHAREVLHRDRWLDRVRAVAPKNYDLACELLENRRLIKGYSDTHARGTSKFDRVMEVAARLEGREDAADWVRRLRQAALLDEEGKALDAAVMTVESFL
jgi:indolepyruvate ferredoxin oxidoreductase beta subunit